MIVSRYFRINRDNSIIKFWKRKRLKKSGTTGVREYQRYCLLKLYHSETRCTRGKTGHFISRKDKKEYPLYETETGNDRNAEGDHG